MDTSDAGSVKPTVYIETSIVSYLTARPSRDLLVAAHQQLTVAWWDEQQTRYELFTSQVVLAEARAGDPEAAQDALHLAMTCVHGMQYLLTWNCTHLANARLRSRIEQVCREAGYVPPIICTPEELEG